MEDIEKYTAKWEILFKTFMSRGTVFVIRFNAAGAPYPHPKEPQALLQINSTICKPT